MFLRGRGLTELILESLNSPMRKIPWQVWIYHSIQPNKSWYDIFVSIFFATFFQGLAELSGHDTNVLSSLIHMGARYLWFSCAEVMSQHKRKSYLLDSKFTDCRFFSWFRLLLCYDHKSSYSLEFFRLFRSCLFFRLLCCWSSLTKPKFDWSLTSCGNLPTGWSWRASYPPTWPRLFSSLRWERVQSP